MCDTASGCQVSSKQRIHTVRFSETPERIEVGAVQTPCKTNSPIEAASFTRRGILSKTRLTPPSEDQEPATTSAEHDQDDHTARSSSAPTTNVVLHHKDSLELILKRGISMISKSSDADYLSSRSKIYNKQPQSTKWKMRFWVPKCQIGGNSGKIPDHSKKETGILELVADSDSANSSEAPEQTEASNEVSGCSEENNEDDNFLLEEYESSVDFQPSEVSSEMDTSCVRKPSVTNEQDSNTDEEKPEQSEQQHSS